LAGYIPKWFTRHGVHRRSPIRVLTGSDVAQLVGPGVGLVGPGLVLSLQGPGLGLESPGLGLEG